MVKLEGGGGSAKAAAAVTELLCRGDDCQLGLNRAVGGAQRNHWDPTEQRRDTKTEEVMVTEVINKSHLSSKIASLHFLIYS